MKLIAIKDLKSPKTLRAKLKEEGELLLTSNGKPTAIMLDFNETDDLEETLKSIRAARSQVALRRIRKTAAQRGIDNLSGDAIDEIISTVRRNRVTTT